MKRLLAFLFLAIAVLGASLSAQALASSWPLGPYTLTANTTLSSCASTGCVSVNLSGDPGLSNCTPTAASGSTFGGGTLTFYTSADGLSADAKTVSGFADLGNPTSGVSTLTSSGSLTFPVAAHTTLYVVLTGATSPNIVLYFNCSRGVARISGSGGGGGGSASIAAASPLTVSPAPSGSPTQTISFATLVSFLKSYSGVIDLYPFQDTTGTTATDVVGTDNGTYSSNVGTDLATWQACTPLGLQDASCGIDAWNGTVHITGLSTGSGSYTEGFVFKSCNINLGSSSGSIIFAGYADSGTSDKGFDVQYIANNSPTSLQGYWGNGSGLSLLFSFSNRYEANDCRPVFIALSYDATGSVYGAAHSLVFWENGLPLAGPTAVTGFENSTSVLIGNLNGGAGAAIEGMVYGPFFVMNRAMTNADAIAISNAAGR